MLIRKLSQALVIAAAFTTSLYAHENQYPQHDIESIEAPLVIQGGYIIDVTSDREPYAANLILHEGVIEEILSHDAPIPDDATVINASGKYIIPGLIDAHVHIDSADKPGRKARNEYFEKLLKQNLRGGVTSVRDMGGDGRLLAELRRASVLNEIPSPEIFFSGQVAGPTYHREAAARLKRTFAGWP